MSVVNHFLEPVFPHGLCPGQLREGPQSTIEEGLSMRGLAESEVDLTRTACRAFLLTVLAMGATALGYFLAIWL
jgi:hypothetical protein